MSHITVSQIAQKRGRVLEESGELFLGNAALLYEGFPLSVASAIEVRDEIKYRRAFVLCCSRKMMGVELLAHRETVEDWLYFELMNGAAQRRTVVLSRGHCSCDQIAVFAVCCNVMR
jgi:hypothetical protein